MESTDSSNQKKNPSTISTPSSSSRPGLPKAAGSQQPDQDPLSSKPPKKLTIAPCQLRNGGSALSLKDIRDAAQKLRQNRAGPSAGKPDPLMADAVPESSPDKSKKPNNSIKLPEKYEILDEIFGSLDRSIRLLRINGSKTTFSNISRLTDRRFTKDHLAQIKYILPEAIELKRALVHDKGTSCMIPDLHITLDAQAVQDSLKGKSESKDVELRNAFRSQLVDFVKAHPEGDEIPLGDLPELFNPSKKAVRADLSTTSDLSMALHAPPVSSRDQNPVIMSHFAPSFAGRFSRLGEIKQQDYIVTSGASVHPVSTPQVIAERKDLIPASSVPTRLLSKARSRESSPVLATPVKDAQCSSSEIALLGGAPSKLTSTPMSKPPERSYMSLDDVSTQPANKLVRRSSRGKSLKFDTPVKNAEDDVQESSLCSAVDSVLLVVRPDNLIPIMEKEKKALLDQDPAISQAKWRQQMLPSLPKLFDTIFFLFQSIGCSVITKEELMHKIISSQVNIVDKREVEDQLKLLQELAPEWIYEKSSTSGDILLRVNKISSPESVRTRLSEVK